MSVLNIFVSVRTSKDTVLIEVATTMGDTSVLLSVGQDKFGTGEYDQLGRAVFGETLWNCIRDDKEFKRLIYEVDNRQTDSEPF